MNRRLNPETFLPDRLAALAHMVTRPMADALAQDFGISIPEWRVIVTIGHCPGLAAVDVAARTTLDEVAVSRAVGKLVARGIVARQPDDGDRRRSVLELSDSGESLRTRLESRALRMEAELLQGLTAADHDALLRLLDKLCARAKVLARAS